ncbi:UNVERIFIED_ORG: hypothetical protein CLV66_1067 [Actinomadura viridilutea]
MVPLRRVREPRGAAARPTCMAGLARTTGAAAALAGTIALAACGPHDGTPDAAPSPAPSARQTDRAPAERLVLRWRRTGGIAGLGGPGALPDFSLYADGRAVFAQGAHAQTATEYRLTPDALRRLLDEARAAGLARSRTRAPRQQVADAFIVEITMGGARTRIVHPEGVDDPAVRFLDRLHPPSWAASDQAGPSRPYRPARVAVLAGRVGADTGAHGVRAWPLAPLGRGERAAGRLCTVLTGRDAATAARLAAQNRFDTAWRSDGRLYAVRFRPLLPDEETCADLARA